MIGNGLLSCIGFALIAVSAILLYAASEHQRLFKQRPPARPLLIAGALALLAGIVAWVFAWGGLVGGIVSLAVWMGFSVALPYLLARRTI